MDDVPTRREVVRALRTAHEEADLLELVRLEVQWRPTDAEWDLAHLRVIGKMGRRVLRKLDRCQQLADRLTASLGLPG